MNNLKQKTINTIRVLAADTVQKANSGHPGAPMGMAPMAYAIFADSMNHNPRNPLWHNRDRFVLSSGHASALVYSLLHLFGYGLTIDDLKSFRQWGSKTPGHPEYKHTVGVETTTGPLGQGVANAVGFAIAETMLAAKFNRPDFPIVDHYTYAICGDGCMMEGITSEACSLAGTLELSKLILFYDDNEISIEGDTDIAMKEDVGLRYQAYGWHVQTLLDGNDEEAIAAAIALAKQDKRPSLIIVPTIIGFGCPNKAGKASAHGEPLGADNVRETKINLGLPTDDFFVADDVYRHLETIIEKGAQKERDWQNLFAAYEKAYPQLKKEWDTWFANEIARDILADATLYEYSGKMATRNTSFEMIQRLAARIPNLVGGSADLAPSNKSNILGGGDYSAENRLGRNLHFGVREHAMAAISNGMAVHGGLRVYCATFFVFSDYMKNAMRMSAIMKLPVVYILTHDSIGVGEDGPTHQPIEHLAGLRAIPDLNVFRPADGKETTVAWLSALSSDCPTCIVLTRQDLPLYERSGTDAFSGAYIISDSERTVPDILLMASGSEVEQMIEAQAFLKRDKLDARVISIPCMELFDAQPNEYKERLMPSIVRARIAMEAGATMPWYKYVGLDGAVIGLDHFGASAPAKKLFEAYGFNAANVATIAKEILKL